jgi:hypothetical protein
MLHVQCFGGAHCNTDHYLAVKKSREIISVSKGARQKFDLERFELRNLNDDGILTALIRNLK